MCRDHPLEKEMATHSSILVWEIPWTVEPGRLQSTGLQRGRYDLATKQEEGETIQNDYCNEGELTTAIGRVLC